MHVCHFTDIKSVYVFALQKFSSGRSSTRSLGQEPFTRSRFLMAEFLAKGQFRGQYIYKCHLEYGPVILIWFYFISVVHICDSCTSSAVCQYLTDSSSLKARWVYALVRSVCGERFLGTILATSTDHKAWERRHQTISPGLHEWFEESGWNV